MTNLNIPEGYQTVMPYLILRDANGFLDFTKKVFNATEKMKHMSNEQLIMHAEIQIDGSTIMFAESTEDYQASNGGAFCICEECRRNLSNCLKPWGNIDTCSSRPGLWQKRRN